MTQSKELQRPKFSIAIQTDTYKNLINNTLQDPKRAGRFIATISSAVATNPSLQDCDAGSILTAALVGEALNLSPSPQLGQYYLVPYDVKIGQKDERGYDIKIKKAQFQLGYKGYVQLAARSGQYKHLNVLAIKEGELINFNPLTETIEVRLIDDEVKRESAVTIGYYAMFEYMNGFVKAIYWSKAKMIDHADKYSTAFSKNPVKGKKQEYNKVSFEDFEQGKVKDSDMWLYSSFWYKDFDGMAFKTMLRQLISKWGVMSIDMQDALSDDMAIIGSDGSRTYVDNTDDKTPTQSEEIVSSNAAEISADNAVNINDL